MSETQTILGGVELAVTLLDGTNEAVKVRDLPMRELPRYWELVEDEGKCIELFCSKPEGWADSLTRESWEKALALGEERNLDFLLRFSRRTSARREKVMPGLQAQLVDALARSLGSAQPVSPDK